MNADEFNALYEVGIPVFAYPGARPEDDPADRRLVTRTRSKAQKSSSGHDVVWVDGEGSYIGLTHVDVVPEDEWEATKTADAVAEQGALPMPVGPALTDVAELRARLFGFVEAGATEEDLPSFAATLNEYMAASRSDTDPLIVRRVDMTVEPARFDGETETLVACIAEDGRPVALLLDDENRARLARNLRMDGGES